MEKNKIKVTMNAIQGQICALLPAPAIGMLLMIAYLLYGKSFFTGNDDWRIIVACGAAMASMIPHEFIHFLGWNFVTKRGLDCFTIKLKGLLGASITFHGNMSVKDFMVGLLAPTITTAIIPCVIGVVIGSFSITFYGILMFMGCGSDILMFFKLLKYRDCNCYDPGNITGVVVLQ